MEQCGRGHWWEAVCGVLAGRGLSIALLALVLASARAQAAAHPVVVGPGRALVVGNGQYPGKNSLGEVPAEDARRVSAALKKLGYRVDLQDDAWEPAEFQSELADFVRQAKKDQEALVFFYYSGHGLVIDGRSWLVPSQGPLPEPWPQETLLQWAQRSLVDLDQVVLSLSQSNAGAVVVVIDACRSLAEDPRERFSPLGRGPGDRDVGIAMVNLPSTQTTIWTAYATLPGRVAANDGQYARALADMVQGGRDVLLPRLFGDVTQRFLSQGQRGQVPQAQVTGTADVCLAGTPTGCGARAASAPPPPIWSKQGPERGRYKAVTMGLRATRYQWPGSATDGSPGATNAALPAMFHADVRLAGLSRPFGSMRASYALHFLDWNVGGAWSPNAGWSAGLSGGALGAEGGFGPAVQLQTSSWHLAGGLRWTPLAAGLIFGGDTSLMAGSVLRPSVGVGLTGEGRGGQVLQLWMLDFGPLDRGGKLPGFLDEGLGPLATPIDLRVFFPWDRRDDLAWEVQYQWLRSAGGHAGRLEGHSLVFGMRVAF